MAVHPAPYDLLKSIIDLSTSSMPIEAKLDGMLQGISRFLGSDRCLLVKPDEIGESGFLAHVSKERKPLWVNKESPLRGEQVLIEEQGLLCPTFACLPLYDDPILLGVLYIGFSEDRTFSSQEADLLLLIAKEMQWVIRSERAWGHAKRTKQLSTLWELSKALLTTVNFERIVEMTLTAITIGDGLGFNRAMIFLVNEKDRVLEGTMAVGPDDAEEAGRIWSSLSRKKETLLELITRLSPRSTSTLNSIVKGLRIPLEQEACILSRTVLEGRSFNIQLPQFEVGVESGSNRSSRTDSYREGWLQTRCEKGCHLGSEVGCYVGEHLGRDPRAYSFATVPLWGKGKVIGVILVDNLYNQNPITEEDIHFLSMFSNQAGLAIENALLYRNLEEVHQELKETQNLLIHREKMAAIGELCNSVAHEIKNPLVAIGGFARRLYREIPDGTPEKRYTQTIMIEVARLERILDDLFRYTRDESMAGQDCDLRDILEETLSMVSEKFDDRKVVVVKEFAQDLPKVHGDYQQLKQAFFNMIHNAYQAMDGEGRLSVRIRPLSKNGSSFVRVELEDTGKGIDPENLHNIFNPFYSTKESGLGLGLPIVHKIVLSHRGQIEVDNHPGEGVNFIITFPARPDATSVRGNGQARKQGRMAVSEKDQGEVPEKSLRSKTDEEDYDR